MKTTHLEELDIIGDGDQVVGPGSLHRSGYLYHWHEYLSLTDLDPAEPPAPLIAWLIEHGIFRPKSLASTQMYPQMPSRKLKAASRVCSQGDRPTRVTSADVNSGDHDGVAAPHRGGGYKTRSTNTRLVAAPLGIGVAELALKPDLQVRCLTFFGLDDVAQNVAHRCRVPGHRERRPSAVLRRGDNGHLVYECLHARRDEMKVYTFPDLYRARLCGHSLAWSQRVKGPVLMPWWERLLVDMGELTAVPVPHRQLPASMLASVQQVYAAFLHLCGCKWLYEPGAPTTFAVRFGMEWSEIGSHHTFSHALQTLVQQHYIDELPAYTSKITGKVLALYRPARE